MPMVSVRTVSTFALLALALVALGACRSRPESQGGPGPNYSPIPFEEFEQADTDQDGKLDREETDVHIPTFSRYFVYIDTDNSGFLSWSEVRAARFPIIVPPPLRR